MQAPPARLTIQFVIAELPQRGATTLTRAPGSIVRGSFTLWPRAKMLPTFHASGESSDDCPCAKTSDARGVCLADRDCRDLTRPSHSSGSHDQARDTPLCGADREGSRRDR